MKMNWGYLFLSMEGRINRKPFWLAVVVLVVISLIASILDLILHTPRFGATDTNAGEGPIAAIVSLIMIYPSIALSAKRWHDRNKSAWWILINIIPVIGWIWSLVETGFLRGTDGPNRFGPDPLTNGLMVAAE
jgi:uncharacterized membrane protein YhaH (DUF805 family)